MDHTDVTLLFDNNNVIAKELPVLLLAEKGTTLSDILKCKNHVALLEYEMHMFEKIKYAYDVGMFGFIVCHAKGVAQFNIQQEQALQYQQYMHKQQESHNGNEGQDSCILLRACKFYCHDMRKQDANTGIIVVKPYPIDQLIDLIVFDALNQ
jgi:histidinol phosphatase-like enzyme